MDAKRVPSATQMSELIGHRKKVHAVAWNSKGTKLATGSVDHSARVWEPERPVQSLELKGHTDSVEQLCWDPTHHERLATVSMDKTVRIWDTRAGKVSHTIGTNGDNINIAWSPDGSHIAVGNKDDLISIIDARKYKLVKTTQFPFEVNEISWNPTGDLFFLTTGQGMVEILRFPDLKQARTIAAHTANVFCLKFDPTRKYFAVGSADSIISLWDLEELVCVRTFPAVEWPIRALSFTFDGQFIASATEDPVIDIFSVETGERVYEMKCGAPLNAVAWHPKRYILASAGDDKDREGRDSGVVRLFSPTGLVGPG